MECTEVNRQYSEQSQLELEYYCSDIDFIWSDELVETTTIGMTILESNDLLDF